MSQTISHHSALIYTMVVVSAADGSMNDAELHTIGEIVNTFPISRTGFDVRVTGLQVDNLADVQQSITAAIEEYFLDYRHDHRTCRRPFAGIPALLGDLRSRDIRLAVVTGKGPRSAAISLEVMGLADTFERVEAGSPQGAVKPDCMRRVVEDWGVDPAEVLSVGDAPSDVRSARTAGLPSAAAAWAATADASLLRAEQPDELFERVADLRDWVRSRT